MPAARIELALPRRQLVVGGPSTPDDRVLAAMTTPVIGQFDPAFTAIMDEVMQLARGVLLTRNSRCFPISALPSAGMEALLNTLLVGGERVAVIGSKPFAAHIADMVERCGATLSDSGAYTVAPHVDPYTGEVRPLAQLAAEAHAKGSLLLVDATYSLGGHELRTDDWQLDAVVAGVDYCIGAPSGMTLVTYSEQIERRMQERQMPPSTSYLDLLQLQAYWSPERLNHHTAPTSLVYGLHEALRLVSEEGLEARWARHGDVADVLRNGLRTFGLQPRGDGPLLLLEVPDGSRQREQLRDQRGISIAATVEGARRIALLGADAEPQVCRALLDALKSVLSGE
jgi:(S)-ureidoglycine-glyoxylate aminotransferase